MAMQSIALKFNALLVHHIPTFFECFAENFLQTHIIDKFNDGSLKLRISSRTYHFTAYPRNKTLSLCRPKALILQSRKLYLGNSVRIHCNILAF